MEGLLMMHAPGSPEPYPSPSEGKQRKTGRSPQSSENLKCLRQLPEPCGWPFPKRYRKDGGEPQGPAATVPGRKSHTRTITATVTTTSTSATGCPSSLWNEDSGIGLSLQRLVRGTDRLMLINLKKTWLRGQKANLFTARTVICLVSSPLLQGWQTDGLRARQTCY